MKPGVPVLGGSRPVGSSLLDRRERIETSKGCHIRLNTQRSSLLDRRERIETWVVGPPVPVRGGSSLLDRRERIETHHHTWYGSGSHSFLPPRQEGED